MTQATDTVSGTRNIPRIPYDTQRIFLDAARDNELILTNLSHDFIGVVELVTPTAVGVSIRLNYPDAAPIALLAGRTIETPPAFLKRMYAAGGTISTPPIRRIYMTHAASAGGYLDLAIGGDASFVLGAAGTVAVIGISTMIAQLNTLIATTASELQRAITGVDLSAVLLSTSTPLGAGLTWTSGWIAVDRYSILVATIIADTNTSLIIEQSWETPTVDAKEECAAIIANEPTGICPIEVVAPHVRVKLTNTAVSGQTSLRFRLAGRVL